MIDCRFLIRGTTSRMRRMLTVGLPTTSGAALVLLSGFASPALQAETDAIPHQPGPAAEVPTSNSPADSDEIETSRAARRILPSRLVGLDASAPPQALAPTAGEAAAGSLATRLVTLKVTDDGTGEQLTPAFSAQPGDLIEYRVLYGNLSDQRLDGVVVSHPLPQGAVLMPTSLECHGAGGEAVVQTGNSLVCQPQHPLEPYAVFSLRYRVRVGRVGDAIAQQR